MYTESMKNRDNYFNREGQESFVDIFEKDDIKNGQNFPRHWHEHLQIYYFIRGTSKTRVQGKTALRFRREI